MLSSNAWPGALIPMRQSLPESLETQAGSSVLVEVEVDVGQGIPGMVVVGLPDAAVRESQDRVRAAVRNSSGMFPLGLVTVNLTPRPSCTTRNQNGTASANTRPKDASRDRFRGSVMGSALRPEQRASPNVPRP